MRAFFVTHRMKTESSASSAAPITPVSSIPQFSSMYASRDSNSWGVRPDGMASSTDIDAAELKRINECVRSGREAANIIAIRPASLTPRSAARSDPTASSTAKASSAHSSQLGRASNDTGSDAPIPRRSSMIKRLNDASRRSRLAYGGYSQRMSRASPIPGIHTKSTGPSPRT